MAFEEKRTEAAREDTHEDHDDRESKHIEEPRAGTSNHHSDDNFVTKFQLLRGYFDKKFCSLKRDLVEDAEYNSHNMAKRIKQDKKVEFKFKGNKKQYGFNSGIVEHVKDAIDLIRKQKESKVLKSSDKVVVVLTEINLSAILTLLRRGSCYEFKYNYHFEARSYVCSFEI